MKTTQLHSVFTLFTLTFFLAGCGKKEAAPPPVPPPAPPEVLVTEATQKDVPIFHEAIATLDGSTNTPIHAQVTGYLIKINYTKGVVVKAGDLLFQIDPRPFQADLNQANANLAAAQGNTDAAKAAVVAAQVNLGHTKITSPIEGIVGKAQPGVGDLITPNTPLTTVSTVNPIQADFTVTKQFYLSHADLITRLSALPPSDRPDNMELVLDDGTVYPKKGKFSGVNRQIQTSTGAIAVYALFPNPDWTLRPGQYAKVRGVTQSEILIPQRAVIQVQGINQVDVVKPDNTIEVRNITLGDLAGSYWIVTNGLKVGEKVVVEGIEKCRPGETVSPQSDASDSTALPVPATNSSPITPNEAPPQ